MDEIDEQVLKNPCHLLREEECSLLPPLASILGEEEVAPFFLKGLREACLGCSSIDIVDFLLSFVCVSTKQRVKEVEKKWKKKQRSSLELFRWGDVDKNPQEWCFKMIDMIQALIPYTTTRCLYNLHVAELVGRVILVTKTAYCREEGEDQLFEFLCQLSPRLSLLFKSYPLRYRDVEGVFFDSSFQEFLKTCPNWFLGELLDSLSDDQKYALWSRCCALSEPYYNDSYSDELQVIFNMIKAKYNGRPLIFFHVLSCLRWFATVFVLFYLPSLSPPLFFSQFVINYFLSDPWRYNTRLSCCAVR